MSLNLTKVILLIISNISMQSKDKLAKIKVNNYCLISASKVSITIYVVRLIKDFRLKFFEQHPHLVNPNFSPRCTQICHNKSRSFLLLISGLCARSRSELVDLAPPTRI